MVAKVLQRPTLVLNRNWQPVNVATVARALVLLLRQTARVVDPSDYQLYDWADWARLEPAEGEPFVRGVRLRLRTGERVYAEGITLAESAVVSIRGQFLAPDRIRVQQFHIHAGRWRSLASLLGLVLICAIWTESALRGWRRRGSGRIRAEE